MFFEKPRERVLANDAYYFNGKAMTKRSHKITMDSAEENGSSVLAGQYNLRFALFAARLGDGK